MRRPYSRLAASEEKKNLRQTIIFGGLTIVLLIVFIFFGLPAIAKFVGFLSDLRTGTTPIDVNDKTPPAPPQITPPPEATKEQKVQIEGKTEAGATVKLFLNDKEDETVADKDGKFTVNFLLRKGENTFAASAKDLAGNESQKSKEYTIIFDNQAPILDISSPSDGTTFYGSKQRQILIEGKTEIGASLTINDRFVSVAEDGTFVFGTSLADGNNTFNIKAEDKAGNKTEKSLSVTFSN